MPMETIFRVMVLKKDSHQVCYLYLSLMKAKDSSMAFRVRSKVGLGVSVTDIAVVEGREEKAFVDEFGVEIRVFGFVCAGVVGCKGDIEHGRDAGDHGDGELNPRLPGSLKIVSADLLL
jgi:hypothetical protein